ncbi:MAG: hypothetical protein L0220_21160 [Acidobacteria bacterium]|nr:hypothetical protein [Acidobacteriota bacterium]
MTKKMIAVSCASFLLLIQPQVLLAQDGIAQDNPAAIERNVANSKGLSPQDAVAQDNWEAVRSIPAGDEITVETRDGKRMKGRMSGISGTTLTFSSKNRPVSLDQPEIKKIYRQVTGGSRAKNSLLGTAIGAGIGAGIGLFFVAAYGEGVDADAFATLMGFGAGIGAGVGVLFKGSKKLLIYEVK